ncbi:MAG TPA: histidine kinase dimerization/phospho-acceptor domain-containing protein [Candidatus Binatia bacterium]|nr:histidine kinase dimerization/phospho-acceptor domain-containing protein [Candidatus Binatia bacterium]
MNRILLIDTCRAVRETVAQLLRHEYTLEQRDTLPEGIALADAAARADLVISSAAAGGAWVAELACLNAPVVLLADSNTAAQAFAGRESFTVLLEPFNPYELKAAVKNLLHQSNRGAAPPPSRYVEYPYISEGAARLARRFEALSLPLLIWGERGCGQDRVARAILRKEADSGTLVVLNGTYITADDLKRQQEQLIGLSKNKGAHPALLVEALERVVPCGQALLLNLIDALDGMHGRLRLIATANTDLLERVYRGEFLERLYYKLAKLTLPLAPLRERRGDLPALVRRFAADYLTELDLVETDFTPAALARLGDYLWFGNLDEFELVIARTLAIHHKARIDAADLVFDVATFVNERSGESAAPGAATGGAEPSADQRSFSTATGFQPLIRRNGSATGSPHLRLLVHELAHELKNPMVTIKTFAQLLTERYDDANFRARFQDVVDGDIERMNELLAVMAEYAGFDQPRNASTALAELLNTTVDTIQEDCARRQIHVTCKANSQALTILADPAQLRYALRNTLLAVLSQAKPGSVVELALAESGALVISYLREGERMQSLANYFNDGDLPAPNHIVPLRIILAREIVERSGGRFRMDETDGGRDILKMEFPVV